MKVKTLQPHEYAQQQRAIGDEYEMEDRFYPPMSAMGHVIRADQAHTINTRNLGDPTKKYKRRDSEAAESEKPESGRYDRRDLRAKD